MSYTKYLFKQFNKETSDCAHLAALYIRDNLNINTDGMDKVSRDYNFRDAAECIYKGMTDNGMIEINNSSYKEGDVIIYKIKNFIGTCAVCVNDKMCIAMDGASYLTQIGRIENILWHLRHKDLT